MLPLEDSIRAEIEELAVNLAIARAYWRQYRQLVEAALGDVPGLLASELGEDFEIDDPAPSDLYSEDFSAKLKDWATRRAATSRQDCLGSIRQALSEAEREVGAIEWPIHCARRDAEFSEFMRGLGISEEPSRELSM